MGFQLAEFAANEIPGKIRSKLEAAFPRCNPNETPQQPQARKVCEILSSALSEFDEHIRNDILDLFPNGQNFLANLSDQDIKQTINDQATGGMNHAKAMRSICGTTALICLVDARRENLWIANLGDCQASEPLQLNKRVCTGPPHPTFSAWHGDQ